MNTTLVMCFTTFFLKTSKNIEAEIEKVSKEIDRGNGGGNNDVLKSNLDRYRSEMESAKSEISRAESAGDEKAIGVAKRKYALYRDKYNWQSKNGVNNYSMYKALLSALDDYEKFLDDGQCKSRLEKAVSEGISNGIINGVGDNRISYGDAEELVHDMLSVVYSVSNGGTYHTSQFGTAFSDIEKLIRGISSGKLDTYSVSSVIELISSRIKASVVRACGKLNRRVSTTEYRSQNDIEDEYGNGDASGFDKFIAESDADEVVSKIRDYAIEEGERKLADPLAKWLWVKFVERGGLEDKNSKGALNIPRDWGKQILEDAKRDMTLSDALVYKKRLPGVRERGSRIDDPRLVYEKLDHFAKDSVLKAMPGIMVAVKDRLVSEYPEIEYEFDDFDIMDTTRKFIENLKNRRGKSGRDDELRDKRTRQYRLVEEYRRKHFGGEDS